MIRFLWNTLTRFSKTVGCILFVAGLGVAGWLYNQREPTIDSARYREPATLMDRISRLNTNYGNAQRLVIQFKGTGQFPPEYSQAANKPQFLQRYSESKDFAELRAELSKVSNGKSAMQQFVMTRFETLISEIQKKLLDHAATVKSESTPSPAPEESPAPTPAPPPDALNFHLKAGQK